MTAVAPRAASATTGTARASPFAISAGTTTATNSASTTTRTFVPHPARGSPTSGVMQATAQQARLLDLGDRSFHAAGREGPARVVAVELEEVLDRERDLGLEV